MKLSWTLCLPALALLLALIHSLPAQEPDAILNAAVATWHMRSLDDSVGGNSQLTIRGAASVGKRLSDADFEQSRARGGDGFAAQLAGGWLDAGQGFDGELELAGDRFTALIRLKCDSPNLWATRGFFTRGGGHDQLVFNFFSHDFEQGREGMRVGCEIGLDGRGGLGGQVTVPIPRIGPTDWHDYVARYDGRELALFVDGVPVERKPASGRLRQGCAEPLCIGAGGAADQPFACWVDHAAVWSAALTDDEIVTLSGGPAAAKRSRDAFDAWIAPPTRPPIKDLIQQSRELERILIADPHRPRYHLLHFEAGDIMPGDPNGAIYWKGRYHLFYIFQRQQADEPNTVHCWGHASSVDLVHWEHHPTALDVAPSDPDRGIFSGNALIARDGTPTLIYHGVGVGNCLATALDERLIRWKKSATNPLVPIPAAGEPMYGKYDSWDPHAWLEGDAYYAIFGGNPGTGAPATLFRGTELAGLSYVGPFLPNDRWSQPGEDVSCPDFFSLGAPNLTRHMLLCISHARGARYFLGEWKDEAFVPQAHGRMNWPGGCFFAPETLVDDRGRRILWAWCLDERPASMRASAGWSGVMSLPRVLSLDAAGELQIHPVEELQRLRINAVSLRDLGLPAESERPLPQIDGDSMEIQVEFPSGIQHPVGLKVRQSPDRAEETVILYDPTTAELSIDVSRSSLDPAIRYRSWCLFQPPDADEAARAITRQQAPLALKPGESLRLRVFLDRSLLEVFANERQCMTQRVWPTRLDATRVSLVNLGPPTLGVAVQAWEMAASNRN